MEISCLKNENIFDLFEELIVSSIERNKNVSIKRKESEIKIEKNNNTCNII